MEIKNLKALPPSLPSHKKKPCLQDFSDIVKNYTHLNDYNIGNIYVDDFNLLRNNIDIFQDLIISWKISTISSKDYDCLKYIEEQVKDYSSIELKLIDDFKNKDRSYIDTTIFEKTTLVLPLPYVFWDPVLKQKQRISGYTHAIYQNPFDIQSFDVFSSEELKRIKELINNLSEKFSKYDDLQKTLLISNYLQRYVQFVDRGNRSEGLKGIYITDSGSIEVGNNVHSPLTVLEQHFGVCEGIGNAATMLLNNPSFNVNVRSVFGSNHVWNVVQIDGKFYFLDNTWAITRNKNQYEESLKAKSFDSNYFLFGSDKANIIGHHIADSVLPEIESSDYPSDIIYLQQQLLSKDHSFDNYNPPMFKSKILK